MENQPLLDVVIIGGSYAGLSAALTLGRSIRPVLVLDSGEPCSWQTPHAHNFLTQDGQPPAAMVAVAREQVLAYPTVQLRHDIVVDAVAAQNNFRVTTAKGSVVRARKLLFATGIRDLMPPLLGFAACWGISAIHCPYCHGYEYRDQPTGILANGETAVEMSLLLRNWTDQLTLFTNGASTLLPAQQQHLAARGICVEQTPLRQLLYDDGQLTHVVLRDRRHLPFAALYARLPFEQHCALPRTLGCTHTATGHIAVDELQRTSRAGIYAAGDATTMLRAVSVAVAAGMTTGAMLNKELVSEI